LGASAPGNVVGEDGGENDLDSSLQGGESIGSSPHPPRAEILQSGENSGAHLLGSRASVSDFGRLFDVVAGHSGSFEDETVGTGHEIVATQGVHHVREA
jgi:hypothetical protein